jgi:hypothetical protein
MLAQTTLDAPTIDLAIGYNKTNTSHILSCSCREPMT